MEAAGAGRRKQLRGLRARLVAHDLGEDGEERTKRIFLFARMQQARAGHGREAMLQLAMCLSQNIGMQFEAFAVTNRKKHVKKTKDQDCNGKPADVYSQQGVAELSGRCSLAAFVAQGYQGQAVEQCPGEFWRGGRLLTPPGRVKREKASQHQPGVEGRSDEGVTRKPAANEGTAREDQPQEGPSRKPRS